MAKTVRKTVRSKPTRVPKYRQHSSGQAFVEIRRRRIYLGEYGSEASLQRYAQELEQLGIREPAYRPEKPTGDYTVVELAANYVDYAEQYYSKDGQPTKYAREVGRTVRMAAEHYGSTPVVEFGPLKLKRLVSKMVDAGHSRTTVNKRLGALKQMFRWGVAEELVPAHIWQALDAVEGIHKGRTPAPEPKPVEPVEDEVVNRTLDFLTEVVADMVRFERATGCRPSEVCIVRPMDIDRSGEVWRYYPDSHKTEHFGHKRVVYIGPKGQDVLGKYLQRPEDAYCFSPREAEQQRLEALHEKRRTPLSCGNRPGSNRRRWPKRRAGDRYKSASYRRAIERAVQKLNKHLAEQAKKAGEPAPEPVPKWTPNRLRHTAGTNIRHKFGLEAAQVMLGHRQAAVTQIYAERDEKLGIEVAKKIG